MPEWITWVIAVVGGLGGLTGLGAYIRARGENRTDSSRSLTEAQNVFNQGVAAELAALRQQTRDLEADKDKAETRLNDTIKLSERLLERSETQERLIQRISTQNAEQARQIAEQSQQIAALTDEKKQYIERLAVVEGQRTFLESEVNILRQDNQRLRDLLPARVEVSE